MATKRGKKWRASGYDPRLSRKVHLGTFDTHKAAVRAEADHKLRARTTVNETCDAFAKRWVSDYPRPKASTNAHNNERVQRFARDFKGVKLTAIDKPTARAWAMANLSQHSAVRAMFGDAVRDGLLEANPFAGLRIPGSRGRKDLIVLTEEELVGLADVALTDEMELGDWGKEYRAQVLFSGYVGLRPGELFALRRDDINGAFCNVERSLDSKTRTIGLPKNGKARVVTIPPPAQEALRDVPVHESGLLFSSPRDRMWRQATHHRYWNLLRRFGKRPGMDYYELRHAGATMLIERGVTPWDVAIQLGQEDGGQLVMELYGHPRHDAARARVLAAWGDDVEPLRSVA